MDKGLHNFFRRTGISGLISKCGKQNDTVSHHSGGTSVPPLSHVPFLLHPS